jgi:hypothetical protein
MQEARQRLKMSDADIVDHFRRLGFIVDIKQLAFTSETVEDYREARLKYWTTAGKLVTDERGLLDVRGAQPRPMRPSRDVGWPRSRARRHGRRRERPDRPALRQKTGLILTGCSEPRSLPDEAG